jgi:hypothetical protein
MTIPYLKKKPKSFLKKLNKKEIIRLKGEK